jgi:formylglycine-generating enzyme required for sulfatase activity
MTPAKAVQAEFAWGDELTPGGRHMANIWQGDFPIENLATDGYERTSPVRAFSSNGYGLGSRSLGTRALGSVDNPLN